MAEIDEDNGADTRQANEANEPMRLVLAAVCWLYAAFIVCVTVVVVAKWIAHMMGSIPNF